MHYRWLAGLLVLVLLMTLVGCSDEQKEEAVAQIDNMPG